MLSDDEKSFFFKKNNRNNLTKQVRLFLNDIDKILRIYNELQTLMYPGLVNRLVHKVAGNKFFYDLKRLLNQLLTNQNSIKVGGILRKLKLLFDTRFRVLIDNETFTIGYKKTLLKNLDGENNRAKIIEILNEHFRINNLTINIKFPMDVLIEKHITHKTNVHYPKLIKGHYQHIINPDERYISRGNEIKDTKFLNRVTFNILYKKFAIIECRVGFMPSLAHIDMHSDPSKTKIAKGYLTINKKQLVGVLRICIERNKYFWDTSYEKIYKDDHNNIPHRFSNCPNTITAIHSEGSKILNRGRLGWGIRNSGRNYPTQQECLLTSLKIKIKYIYIEHITPRQE